MKRFAAGIIVALTFALFVASGIVKAETMTYTDKLGRMVDIRVPISRAAIFQTYELIPALKIWDSVVGIGRYAYSNDLMKATRPDIASVIPSASAGSGLDVNMEVLLKLKPDIVVTWTVKPEAVKFMEDRGLKVIAVYPESLPELLDVIRLHGKLFGREKQAEATIVEMQRLFTLVRERVSRITPDRRRKVLWVGC